MTKRQEKVPGQVIGFKIETDRPEDSAKNIAIQMADSMQLEANAAQDARSFREQATRERKKAKGMSDTLIMLGEYNRKKGAAIKNGEVWKVSRMEPMESYDEDMVKAERIMLVERARDLDDSANGSDKIAEEAKRNTLELQKKLRNAKN